MSVDMNLLKQLRDITFAPLKDCKESLEATNGDLDAAIEWLKKKGAASAAKKADRETNEGAIKTRVVGSTVYAVKLACETDFVAKNDHFQQLADTLLDTLASSTKEIASIEDLPEAERAACDLLVGEFVGKMGENVKLADVYIHTTDNNVFVYSHPGDKIVAVVYYTPKGDNAEHTAKQVALQIAAMNPEYLSIDNVPADIRIGLKEQFIAEVASTGKPADIVEKIVDGKLDKAFSENVLLEQSAIWDDSKKVKDITANSADVTDFVRLTVGA